MQVIEQHTVSKGVDKIRLLDYALEVFAIIPSKSSMKKVIKSGALLVDGKQEESRVWVIENQLLTLIDLELNPPKPLDIKLEVIFEDEYLAVINKPAGIEVSGNKYYTIQNALITNITPSKEKDALKWPKPIHRLDMPTSGLLLVAKTASAIMKLGQQLENRDITKIYRAVVAGNIPDIGKIDSPIDCQQSISHYRCVNRCNSLKVQCLSLVELVPYTGRTHQLRIHLASIGFSIVGDRQYGIGPLLKGKGLFLCAVELSFKHPITSETINIRIKPPNKFDALMEREEKRWAQYRVNKK